MFESWHITEQTGVVRKTAWVYYRASILVMCFIMVFMASPANILLANGLINLQTNFWLMCGVTVGAITYSALVHHGLDIATGRRPVTWAACVLIAVLSGTFGILGLADG